MKRNAIAIACAAVLAIALLLPAGLMGKLQPESAVRDAVKSEVIDPSDSRQAQMPEQQERSTGEVADSSDIPPDEPEFIPGVVLVGISDGASIDQVNERLQQLDYVATDAVTESDLLYGYAELTLSEGVDVEEAMARLEQEDFVAASQPNYVYHALDAEEVEKASESASSVAANVDGPLVAQHIDMSAQATTISDPDRSKQWGLQAIKAYDAWDKAKGNHKVTVAVLDSGLDMNHPDFADANNKTNVISPYSVLQANKHGNTSNVADALGHGTHVAGIISAGTNNGVGVAGVSYNANIMPVQVIEYPYIDDNGRTTNRVTSADAAKGVNYIVNHKNADPSAPVRVINVSFGTTSSYTPASGNDRLFTSALQSASQADILVVYAAGNGGSNGAYTCFPCDADPDGIGVISVQQSGSTYTRVSSSNYNQSGKMTKELSAPGQTIYSTWINSTYKNDGGTSMAAPFVSGTAALVFAVAKDKNISLTAQEAKDILCSTAQDLNTSGFDLQTGYGLIDAKAAVNEVVNGSIKGASTVAVGGTVQLMLTQGTASSWTSSDTSVATVSSSGLVTARKSGTTIITAVRNGKKLYHTLTVQANSIQSCTVSLPSSPSYYIYNGKALEPTVTVKYGSTTLTKNTDYKVTYSNNVKVGTGTVKVTGIGAFKDEVTKTFTIKGQIASVTVSPAISMYTGKAVTPAVTVKGNDGTTLPSSAYTARYYNNINAGVGTAYVIVSGSSSGQYVGSKTAWFTISKPSLETYAGADRYDTAGRIARAAASATASVKGVIVCSCNEGKFPDALSAAGLSGVLGYPVVAVNGEGLTSSDRAALAAMRAKCPSGSLDILVAGGTATVTPGVQSALSAYGRVSHRFAGADRYEVNRLVYEYGRGHGGWSSSYAFVARGDKFPDALTIAPYLVWAKCPIVLVDPSATSLTPAQRSAVSGASQVVALGGTASVTDRLLSAARAACRGGLATRLGGADRYEASASIVEWELARGMSLEGAGFATGERFPDSLASSWLLGSRGSVLGLVAPSGSNSAMMAKARAASAKALPSLLRVFGGTASVPDAVRRQVASAAGWPSYGTVPK